MRLLATIPLPGHVAPTAEYHALIDALATTPRRTRLLPPHGQARFSLTLGYLNGAEAAATAQSIAALAPGPA